MRSGLIAQKLGMTRIFAEDGSHVPVTVLGLQDCQVVGQRTKERDGYVALQLGAGKAKARNTTKAERGQFAVAKVEPKRFISEFRVDEANLIEVGARMQADHFVVMVIDEAHRLKEPSAAWTRHGFDIAAKVPSRPAMISPMPEARNHTPIMRLTTRGTDNVVTTASPIGDRTISPSSSTKYASTR